MMSTANARLSAHESAPLTRGVMTKGEMTEAIIAAKLAKDLSWQEIADALGAGVVWVTSACFGKNSMKRDVADRLCALLDLSPQVSAALQTFPHKSWNDVIPQDPLIYRFYEIIGVYGDTIKEIIHEKFGDGIMSAIDFSMDIDKESHAAGDRVVVKLNGKFLPYKSW